jgi:hypothetical protein
MVDRFDGLCTSSSKGLNKYKEKITQIPPHRLHAWNHGEAYYTSQPAAMDWDAQQIDVKTAFLYGLLPDNEIQYMEQPKEFEEPGTEALGQECPICNQTMSDAMVNHAFTSENQQPAP